MLINHDRLRKIGFRHLKKSNTYKMGKVQLVAQGPVYFFSGVKVRTFEDFFCQVFELGKSKGLDLAKKNLLACIGTV